MPIIARNAGFSERTWLRSTRSQIKTRCPRHRRGTPALSTPIRQLVETFVWFVMIQGSPN
jgi:hypothetical protein